MATSNEYITVLTVTVPISVTVVKSIRASEEVTTIEAEAPTDTVIKVRLDTAQ
jgi:hypothetical protein